VPTVYVDNQPCQSQGYTQDASNYYLWYTVHFSTHQVEIVFAAQAAVPEYPQGNFGLALVAGAVVLLSAAALLFLRRRKRFAPVFALVLAACLLAACSVRVLAEPDKFIQLGTSGDDTLVEFDTTSSNVIAQFGFGGADSIYVGAGAVDKVIVQNGGASNNTLDVDGGSGNNFILQDLVSESGDSSTVMIGTGNETVICNGGVGNDNITVYCGFADERIIIKGGDGNDEIYVDSGKGINNLTIDGGAGNDNITYRLQAYSNSGTSFIDGGAGTNVLVVYAVTSGSNQNFTMYNAAGSVLYRQGVGGVSITVANIEQITVIANGTVLYKS
jgi:hypothetical protein